LNEPLVLLGADGISGHAAGGHGLLGAAPAQGAACARRVLALDCMYLNGMLAMLVMGILYDSTNYFEAALLVALFGCVGSTAMAKFLLRGEVIE
jgi:multisubunit Na+/H+ antiporter MnhF subunit